MKLNRLGILTLALSLTGCASIVSKSQWPVAFNSNPPGAQVTVMDVSGMTVQQGVTPTTMTLASGRGYFQEHNYQVEMKLAGYKDDKGVLQADLNGWYFGNIFFGGLIGMLAVDPVTGAMYRLPREYSVNLIKNETAAAPTSVEPPPKTPATPGSVANSSSRK